MGNLLKGKDVPFSLMLVRAGRHGQNPSSLTARARGLYPHSFVEVPYQPQATHPKNPYLRKTLCV